MIELEWARPWVCSLGLVPSDMLVLASEMSQLKPEYSKAGLMGTSSPVGSLVPRNKARKVAKAKGQGGMGSRELEHACRERENAENGRERETKVFVI